MTKEGDPNFIDITFLTLPNDQATLFVVVLGRNVPSSKQCGQWLVTSLTSLGTLSVYEADYYGIRLAILDNASGQAFWSDFFYIKVNPTENAILNSLKKILSKLPEYKNASST